MTTPLGPIWNANQINLDQNPGTLPNLSDAMLNYFQTLTFTQLTKTVVNFQLVETETPLTFFGIVQIFSPQEMKQVPEGERKWIWRKIHALPSLFLNPDDLIIFQGTQYRVMKKTDYTQYGYVRYDVIQDYLGVGT